MFGINSAEFIVVLIVGVVVLGPSRAAHAIIWLQQGILKLREWSGQMRQYSAELRSMQESSSSDIATSISGLTPSQLDPRSMIREAVAEEMQLWLKESRIADINTISTKESSDDSQR
ncbi:translocase [Arcanobacterium phocisimile]|uniref:Translocase n=1 Tax=Arcanobacterium phocisimile TaxID=1302235 RepID=A0ABX7IHX3_9ACTO|nr:translocase [Arcanobacterium phocisimile]QRV01715.1 translocase [Arcanobacterium phocisimile]